MNDQKEKIAFFLLTHTPTNSQKVELVDVIIATAVRRLTKYLSVLLGCLQQTEKHPYYQSGIETD